MPAPEKTSLDRIVRSGVAILDAQGVEGVTMARVAQSVGVRAPSLYKHVRDRSALLEAVAADVITHLVELLEETEGTVEAIARAYRAFAVARPHAFRLLVGPAAPEDALARAAAPILEAARWRVPPDKVLDAARFATAWVTGFIQMELAGAFRLGGDIDAAFDFGVARVGAALDSAGSAGPSSQSTETGAP